ncbi:hypothetical protein Pmar_PMAR014790 [Perkinsus marinus ATCC 50983]|uniref:Uncharacterized protein n=1 Tax=Perkinsus marinus (strain ATCC 50983 / TXsc) TaxID=423536 RepID=C5L370_PERM5|nr:hypothetical protein Pmar_PMAR014790 [Perkinsus marinus ATCC 50983]EER08823.1 hypothetical protein Pmar_PMAR014790 [Perkinsus marinus ATCC 50983]|eukprot:XP_002777007.1 hypothetical protein Pmar_PMAR014790 [Perkinsus marinus ATCC 50983]
MVCLYQFATTWNAFMEARMIVGVVVDGIAISSGDLPAIINQGTAARGVLKLGLAVGLGTLNGAKNSYGNSVDMYLSFLLDFWVPSADAYNGNSSEFMSRKDKVQDMSDFLLSSISGESPIPQTDTRRYADDTALIWSPRHTGSSGCMYPLNTGTCTNPTGANELGSWSPKEAIELMKSIKSRSDAILMVDDGLPEMLRA